MEVELTFRKVNEFMVLSYSELEVSIRKTVTLYNRMKSPEAITKVVKITPSVVTIEFTGSFCYNCGGILNYIEEFARDFRVFANSFQLEVGQTKQLNPRAFQVDYFIRIRKDDQNL
jgi:hypothetical protein